MKFIKGLNKDASPVDQPEGTYRYAKNILFNETAGAVSNEPGTTNVNQIQNGHRVIGSIEVTDDRVVLFTTDNSNTHNIYTYNPNDGNSLDLVLRTNPGNSPAGIDFDLKFSWDHPIEGLYKIDPDGNLIVYWTDNNNPPRSLNVTRQSTGAINQIYGVNPFASPNTNYVDRLNLFPHAGPVPRIAFDRIANGGALKSGVYYLFLAYVDQNFTQTNYVSYSLGVPIVEDDESVAPIERYDGCEPDTQTGKSIVWEASNLNTDYEFLRPIVVYRSKDAEFAFRLNDIDISSNSTTVIFSGLEGYSSSSVEEAIIDTVAYDTAKTLEQLDGVLYVGNLSGTKDVGYQPYANFIKVDSVVSPPLNPFDPYELTIDNLDYGYLNTKPYTQVLSGITKQGGFRDIDRISSTRNAPASNPGQVQNRKGYTRDEVYAFYIAFILNDGSMSYAYHIPGRTPITVADGSQIRKVGTTNPIAGSTSEDDDLEDQDLIDLTQSQGQMFHFYDFSLFTASSSRNMNFWQNKNEFYPNTDDYLMIDANDPANTVADLRGSNVRHHHMPCNTNSDRRTIEGSDSTITPATDTTTSVYYFYFEGFSAHHDDSAYGGPHQELDNILIDTNNTSVNTSAIDQTGGFGADWEDGSDQLQSALGSISNWQFALPEGGEQGWFLWDTNANSGGTTATITSVTTEADGITDIDLNQTNGGGGIFGPTGGFLSNDTIDQINQAPSSVVGYFVWESTVDAISANGSISDRVRALGVQFSDVKIPQSIADKVQGFRIYYAERKHSNRRILGQDVIKNTANIDDVDISACRNDPGNGGSEDFILSPGVLYRGSINTATFHDFYLLNNRNSLVPATHTSEEYRVRMFSLLGPGNTYNDFESYTNAGDDCIMQDSYVTAHLSSQFIAYTTNSTPFYHFPIREKCKTYLNGDSIYDGRGIGFGKRIFNVGGESSILLAYNPDRMPIQGAFSHPGDGTAATPWHQVPSSNDPFSYEVPSTQVELKLHNLHAFKTDMYLSYDTQELIWTGFEVLGDELDNYTVESDNTSTIGATHRTGGVFGGDTFICRHGYRITHRPAYNGPQPRDHKSLLYVIAESTDNINFRHELTNESSYFPGSPAKRMLDLKAEIDLTKKDNMKYEDHYSLGVADIKPPVPYPLREADPSIFETRIQRSAKDDNARLIDNYRIFKAFQFNDLPRNRGSLWKLATISNLLYIHMEDSLFRTKGKQSLKLSDGTESFVGSGDIFSQDPDEVIQTKFGYGGTQSQWVSMVTKHGYFSLDYKNRKVFMFKDTIYDISRSGLESWFQDNIPFELEQYGLDGSYFDNPIIGIGFHAMYDERYDRIILTKRDLKPTKTFINQYNLGNITYNYNIHKFNQGQTIINFDDPAFFKESGWTVSYDIELNVWVSFHDYIPYKYTRSSDTLVSFNAGGREIWLHNNEYNRGNFYGTDYASEFEFIYNVAKDTDKTFYSFEYMTDVYNSSNSLIHDQGFSSFYIYNTHQISGELDIEYMINTRRVGNAWKINKFRDMAALVNTPVAAGTGSNFGVTGASVAGTNVTSSLTSVTGSPMFNIDGMTETINNAFINAGKAWNNQRKFSDKWVGIRLKYDNITKKLINLYTTDVAAKKFYR